MERTVGVGCVALQRAALTGDEEGAAIRRGVGLVEARGVELHKLHVGHRHTGAVRHRDPVARDRRGVGRARVHLPGAARGEHRGPRQEAHPPGPARGAGRTQAVDADALTDALDGARDEIERVVVLEDVDVAVGGADRRHERPHDLRPRGVRRVHDPPVRVPSLARQVEGAVGAIAREGGAHRGELEHAVGSLAAHHLHSMRAVEEGARDRRVVRVGLPRVVVVENSADPALGVDGAALLEGALGDKGHTAVLGRFDGEGEASDARAEDDEIIRQNLRVGDRSGGGARGRAGGGAGQAQRRAVKGGAGGARGPRVSRGGRRKDLMTERRRSGIAARGFEDALPGHARLSWGNSSAKARRETKGRGSGCRISGTKYGSMCYNATRGARYDSCRGLRR